MFEKLYGHEPIKSYLKRALDENRLPSTLLFSGLEGIGKALFAKEIAKALLDRDKRVDSESHPDLHILRPEGKSGYYSIETVRNMIDRVYQPPFESKRKVFILHEADRMQPTGANALLKTLEEPALDTTIILISSAFQEILPTILSRCIQIRFQPLSEGALVSILTERKISTDFAKLANGSASTALLLAQDPSLKEMKEKVIDLLFKKVRYVELLESLDKIEQLLEPLKEEDPVAYQRRVDLLFGIILMGVRDQHLKLIGGAAPFFPEAPFFSDQPTPLSKIEKLVEESRSAFQRNIKLSTCLERLFLSI